MTDFKNAMKESSGKIHLHIDGSEKIISNLSSPVKATYSAYNKEKFENIYNNNYENNNQTVHSEKIKKSGNFDYNNNNNSYSPQKEAKRDSFKNFGNEFHYEENSPSKKITFHENKTGKESGGYRYSKPEIILEESYSPLLKTTELGSTNQKIIDELKSFYFY